MSHSLQAFNKPQRDLIANVVGLVLSASGFVEKVPDPKFQRLCRCKVIFDEGDAAAVANGTYSGQDPPLFRFRGGHHARLPLLNAAPRQSSSETSRATSLSPEQRRCIFDKLGLSVDEKSVIVSSPIPSLIGRVLLARGDLGQIIEGRPPLSSSPLLYFGDGQEPLCIRIPIVSTSSKTTAATPRRLDALPVAAAGANGETPDVIKAFSVYGIGVGFIGSDCIVTSVVGGGLAANAGIREGDILNSVNDKTTRPEILMGFSSGGAIVVEYFSRQKNRSYSKKLAPPLTHAIYCPSIDVGVQSRGAVIEVVIVTGNGPAFREGVSVRDTVLSVDGVSVSPDTPDLRSKFERAQRIVFFSLEQRSSIEVLAQPRVSDEAVEAYLGVAFVAEGGMQIVKAVAQGGPCDGALFPKDQLLAIDGIDIHGVQIANLFRGRRAGEEVRLSIKRGREDLIVRISFGGRSAADARSGEGVDAPEMGVKFLQRKGVWFVDKVEEDSPAFEGGVRANDEVWGVGDAWIHNGAAASELTAALAEARWDGFVKLQVSRQSDSSFVTLYSLFDAFELPCATSWFGKTNQKVKPRRTVAAMARGLASFVANSIVGPTAASPPRQQPVPSEDWLRVREIVKLFNTQPASAAEKLLSRSSWLQGVWNVQRVNEIAECFFKFVATGDASDCAFIFFFVLEILK